MYAVPLLAILRAPCYISFIIMFDKIVIGESEISTFTLWLAVGIAAMFLIFVLFALYKHKCPYNEISLAVPLLLAALGIGYGFSIILDALFKWPERGFFKLEGMTFYGGLIGGIVSFVILMKIFKKKFTTPLNTWLNILAVGIPLAHMFGRIGCFFGGCCYGGVTTSIFGVYFPEGSPAHDQHGDGIAVYPSQLFEAFALLLIFITTLLAKKHQFNIYLALYAVARFIIEFFRGDDRGNLFIWLSPAQLISILIIAYLIVLATIKLLGRAQKRKSGVPPQEC